MYPDFKELLSVLNEHQVKYLVVGAYAVSIHAQPRATKALNRYAPRYSAAINIFHDDEQRVASVVEKDSKTLKAAGSLLH